MKMLKISLVVFSVLVGFEVKPAAIDGEWNGSLYSVGQEEVTSRKKVRPQEKAMDLFGRYRFKKGTFASGITEQVITIANEVKEVFQQSTPDQRCYMHRLIADFNASIFDIGTLLVEGEAEKVVHKRSVDNRHKVEAAVAGLKRHKAALDKALEFLKTAALSEKQEKQRLEEVERQEMRELLARFTLAMRKNPTELTSLHSTWAVTLSESPHVSDEAKRMVAEHLDQIQSRAKKIERQQLSDITSSNRGELPKNSKRVVQRIDSSYDDVLHYAADHESTY